MKTHPERITLKDEEVIDTLHYSNIEFPVTKNDFNKVEMKNKISINVFCNENKLTFPIHISDQKLNGFAAYT